MGPLRNPPNVPMDALNYPCQNQFFNVAVNPSKQKHPAVLKHYRTVSYYAIVVYYAPHTLSFLSLFFWKKAGKTTKKQGFFIPTEPLKSLEKKGKNGQKNKEILARRKNKEFQKKQGKEGQGIYYVVSPSAQGGRDSKSVGASKISTHSSHRVLQGLAQEGGCNFTLIGCGCKMNLFYLKTCTPVKGNPLKHRLKYPKGPNLEIIQDLEIFKRD